MNFLPISILAYIFNGGATVIDKILLQKSLPHPLVYTFYISVLGFIVIALIPFGIQINFSTLIFGGLAGIIGNFALIAYFESLKQGEASVVSPIVGGLNPFFTLALGYLFLNQTLSSTQLTAFIVLISGSAILTFNLWTKTKFNRQLLMMVLSGLLYAITYLLLKETFLISNFFTGLFISRFIGGIFVLFFLFSKKLRQEIFASKASKHHFANRTGLLLLSGQIMGGISGFLLTYAVSLANPTLVNALFGVQYLVILAVALVLYERHSHILGETLTSHTIVQKIIGVIAISFGLYLLTL